jgi:hypothetical protein
VLLGHTYVILTRTDDADLATVVHVVEHEPRRRVVLDWYTTDGTGRAQGSLTDTGEGRPLARSLEDVRERYRAAALLTRPAALLQLQIVGGGGNPRRIDLAGETLAYVDEVVPQPIALDAPVAPRTRDRAHCVGGWIPRDKSFVVTQLDVRRVAPAPGEALPRVVVRVGGVKLPVFEGDDTSTTASWTGEHALRAGMERGTHVECSSHGGVEVTLRGRFEPRTIESNEGFGAENEGFFVSVAPEPVVVAPLEQPRAVLQARAGARGGNPNRIDILGHTSIYVDAVRDTPLDLSRVPAMRDPSEAYRVGGRVPDGQEFVVTKVTWRLDARGDSNGGGSARIVVAGEKLVARAATEAPDEGVWTGALVIRAGEESRTYVEVSNSSYAGAEIEGQFRAAPGG